LDFICFFLAAVHAVEFETIYPSNYKRKTQTNMANTRYNVEKKEKEQIIFFFQLFSKCTLVIKEETYS